MVPPAYHSIKNSDIEEIEFDWVSLDFWLESLKEERLYEQIPSFDYYDYT